MPRALLPNGVELELDQRGEGEPLLLVMGIGAQMILWPEGFCDALAAQGFRVIRFDNRDVGLSSKLDHLGMPEWRTLIPRMLLGLPVQSPYGLEEMAEDAVHLLDHLGIERAHVVGASMGGMIAQTMAFMYPHRVASLVSMMSHTGQPRVYVSEIRALRALFGKVPRTKDEAIEGHVSLFRIIGSTGFETSEAEARERAALSWERSHHPPGFVRQLGAIAATGDRTTRLRFVKAPTLVVPGSVDPLIRPIGGRLTARAIPGARLEMVEGMGHDLPRGAWPLLARMIADNARVASTP